jgi:feruloyl esterase
MVHGNPEWDISDFDIDRDHPKIVERVTPIMNSNNPDIKAFADRGGRLLMNHGWNDAAIPAGSAIDYVEAVRQTLGPEADDHLRLFMVPALNHCFGGSGPTSFDLVDALDRWVETGDTPERIVATQHDPASVFMSSPDATVVRTRPLCAWPKQARYQGEGSTDDAASFTCE